MADSSPMRMAAYLWDAFVLHVGDGVVTELHAVASVQLVLGLETPITVRSGDGSLTEADCVVVSPNVRHALLGGRFAMFWIEPESEVGRRLVAAHCRRSAIAPVAVRQRDAFARRAAAILDDPRACEVAWRFAADVLAAVAGELPRARPTHPAVRKAVRIIGAQPRSRVAARDVASAVGLSTSRLTHLFRDVVGVPFRRFVMWQRVRRAVVVLAGGRTATEAAHEAGFSDAAHLSRVLKMMLGVRPRDFQAFRTIATLTLRVCSDPRPGW